MNEELDPSPTPGTESIPEWFESAFLAWYHGQDPEPDPDAVRTRFPEQEVQALRLLAAQGTRSASHDDADGLARYELREELGRGGQGVVYRAFDPVLGRDVVVKVLRSGETAGSDAPGMRWSRELRLAARIDHPGVCRLLDYGRDRGRSFATFPFVPGRTLSELLRVARSPGGEPRESAARSAATRIGLLSPRSARGRPLLLAFVEKLARAVQAIHEHDVVHRDLKPANVLVRDDGEPLVLDLGLARDRRGEELSLTGEAGVLGTPAYLAPEQIERSAAQPAGAETSADVWALGVVLFECLTLERPFRGATRDALYRSILADEPGLQALGNGIEARSLRTVLRTAMAKDPRRRYESAGALAEDLLRIRTGRPILAQAPPMWERAQLWLRRRPWLGTAIAGSIVSLGAAVVVLLLLLRERDESAGHLRGKHDAMQQLSREMVQDVQFLLSRVPGTTELRRRMLERGLRYLEILAEERGRDPQLLWELFEARLGLGQVLGGDSASNLGLLDQAAEQFEAAQGVLGQLASGSTVDPARVARSEARLGLALGGVSRMRGRDELARQQWENALRSFGELEERARLAVEDLALGSEIHTRMSGAHVRAGDFDAAVRHARSAHELAANAARMHPEDPDRVADHAASTLGLAHILGRKDAGGRDEALRLLREGLAELRTLVPRHPGHALLAHYQIVFGDLLGRGHLEAGRAAKGIAELEAAWRLHRARSALDAANINVLLRGLRVGTALAAARLEHGHVEDGKALAFEVLLEVERRASEPSAPLQLRERWLLAIQQLSAVFRATGDHEAVVRLQRMAKDQ